MPKVIGIDLGTTNSAVAVVEGGEPTVIENSEGARITPSAVAFTKTGEWLVGSMAKRQSIINPERTVLSIKRRMGSDFQFEVDGKSFTPQEISAMILQKLKTDAEKKLGEKISKAVITTPAYFTDAQRQATKDAGKIAGLEVLRIINEPTAAALAYGLDKGSKEQTIMVYDLGGGTFDVSILDLGEGVFEVKATSGNNFLGGDDFDQRVVDYLAGEFKKQSGIDLKKDAQAHQRLLEAAEKAKIELSTVAQTTVNLPFITADADGPKHLDMALTRAKFEELINDLVEKTVGPVKQAMADAGVSAGDLDQVILVGGSTRIPMVQELVRKLTGKEPNRSVNPDEVVAVGAAIQAAVLTGEVKDILLLDVTPLSLGVETLGGVFTKIIERNTTIPTRKSEVFTTATDNQTTVEIHVLQGEREMAAYNKSLGKFHLVGIPPAPRGMPQVEVTFDIDANGIVNVSAKDLATQKEQKITITATTNLTKDDIDRMVADAQRHSDEDRRKRDEADVLNRANSLVYATDKNLRDYGEKMPATERASVDDALNVCRQAVESGNIDRINSATENLLQASYKLAEYMYKGGGAQQPQTGYTPPAGATYERPSEQPKGGDDGVVDADFKDVK